MSGGIIGFTGNVTLGVTLGSATQSATTQLLETGSIDGTKLAADTAVGATIGRVIPNAKVSGITSGRGSLEAVAKTQTTRLAKGQVSNISPKTLLKGVTAGAVGGLPSTAAGAISDKAGLPAAIDGAIQGAVDAVDTLQCVGENNGNC